MWRYSRIYKLFLDEIKSLLLYLIDFSEDRCMLFKEYHNNCIVGDGDWKQIIMIKYDESTFSVNNGCQKV